MLKLLGRSLQDFRSSYKKLLVFEYFFMLLTSFVIIPVITLLFNRILMVVGSGSLLNGEVYRIGMSYEGVTGLVLIGLVSSFALFIELCVIVIIVQQAYFSKDITITDALLTTLRRTPRLLGFGFVQLLFFLLLLIPFIDSPFSESFYALFNLPIFFQNQVIDASTTMTFIYVALVLILLYIVLRWVFVLHFIMLEGKTITEAIRSSQALTRGRRLRLFVALALLNGAVVGGSFLVITTLSYLPVWLNIDIFKAFSNHYSLTLSTILTYMFTLLVIPINIIVLTRLFYYFGYSQGKKPQDIAYVYRSKLGRLEKRFFASLKRINRPHLWFVVIAIVYLSLALYIGFRANDNLVYAKWTVVISAHRGDTEHAPENSLPSIIDAIEKGYQSVEIDVQMTKDGIAVLHHDQTLLRMTGTPVRIADLTFEELSNFVIGYDANMEPVYIPTFTEALAVAQGRTKLLIDLKPYGPSDALVNEIVRQIQAFDMGQEVYIQSFDQSALLQIRMLEPNIKIGQVLYFALGSLNTLDVDFYTIEQTMLTKQLVEEAHAAGREVWVWTVNSSKNMKEVLKFRIDGMITDYPGRAQSMIELNL